MSDDHTSDHMSDFVSSEIDEETQTTPEVTKTPRRKMTPLQKKNKKIKSEALHKQFADSAPQVRIPTRAEVKHALDTEVHPFQDYQEEEDGPSSFYGWTDDIVTINMVNTTLAAYQNYFNKGKPARSKQTRGPTKEHAGAYNTTHRINVLCALKKNCEFNLHATPTFLYHPGSKVPYNHTWTINNFVHHTCNITASTKPGVSNCAYTAHELAFAIQNKTAILATKNTASIKSAINPQFITHSVSPSFIGNIKKELINFHEGTLGENITKIPAMMQRIKDMGHFIEVHTVTGVKLKEIAIRAAKVKFTRENRKLGPDEKMTWDPKKVQTQDIGLEKEYITGVTVSHAGFLQARRNGCTRVMNSDASAQKGLLKGTCFSTAVKNASGNLVPLCLSWNLEAEGRGPWQQEQKHLEGFDPSLLMPPSEFF